jgi:hypothetical protein
MQTESPQTPKTDKPVDPPAEGGEDEGPAESTAD